MLWLFMSISDGLKEHNSDIRMPVANSNSITAISRMQQRSWYSDLASSFWAYRVDKNDWMEWKGIVLGKSFGSRKRMSNFRKGFSDNNSWYSKYRKKAFRLAILRLTVLGLNCLCKLVIYWSTVFLDRQEGSSEEKWVYCFKSMLYALIVL